MKKWLISFVFLSFTLPLPAYAQTFGAEEFTLENGLQVVVIPNHRAPVVTQMLWMKVGAADETPGSSGMAHYLEHLLFKGTAKVPAGEFSKTVKTLGGEDNAFTGQDYTAFYESVAVSNLPKIMEMDSDRMMHINPPPEHYASEKAVVIEERRQRTENDPRALFAEQLNSALFINHPYGTPVIGWMEEIEKYEWADVKKYYDTWYAPNNAILVISGDITAAQYKPLAEKYYGVLPKKDIPARKRPKVPPAISQTLIRLQADTIHQSMFQKTYIAPTEAKERKDSLALQILAEIMDGGPTTRFYKTLIVEQKKATGLDFDYDSNALDYGTITLGGIPAEGVTPEELGQLIQTEIQKVIDTGVTDKEVLEAVQRLKDEAIFARDSLEGPAMIFGQVLTTGGTVADVERWPDDIGKITKADAQMVAQKYLDQTKPWIRQPVTGYLLPVVTAPEPQEDIQEDSADVSR